MLYGIEYLPPHPLWGSGFGYGLIPRAASRDVYVPQSGPADGITDPELAQLAAPGQAKEASVLSGVEVTEDYCERIVCGIVTQQEAGWDNLLACSQAGFQGVKPYCHPDCAPYYDEIAARYGYFCASVPKTEVIAYQPPAVHVKSLAPALPSMIALARVNGIGEEATVTERAGSALCAFQDWVSQNPYWAAAAVIGAALLAKRGAKK
jgi:hypothetical protein